MVLRKLKKILVNFVYFLKLEKKKIYMFLTENHNKKSKKIKIKLQFIAINPEHVVRIVSRFPQCRQLVRDVCFSNSS